MRPAAARYDSKMREFILPYEAVRGVADPAAVLLEFLQSSYDAAADFGHWIARTWTGRRTSGHGDTG